MADFVMLVLVVAIVGVVVGGSFMRPGERQVALFGDAYSVPLTAKNVETVRRFIWHSRALRAAGSLVVFISLLIVGIDSGDNSDIEYLYVGAGYGAGAVVGELTRRVDGGPRRAFLERRRLSDYVRPWLSWSIGIVSTAAAAGAVLALTVDTSFGAAQWSDIHAREPQSTGDVVALAGALLAVAAFGALLARRIVRQAEPADSADQYAAAHAIRTAALVSLLGVMLMSASVALASVAHELARAEGLIGRLADVALAVAFLTTLGGLYLTVTSLPRFGVFRYGLPDVPRAAESEAVHA